MNEKRIRLYSLDDNLELCWVEINSEIKDENIILDCSDNETCEWKMRKSWIDTVWLKSPYELFMKILNNLKNK